MPDAAKPMGKHAYDGAMCPSCHSDQITPAYTPAVQGSTAMCRTAECDHCKATWIEDFIVSGYHDLFIVDPATGKLSETSVPATE